MKDTGFCGIRISGFPASLQRYGVTQAQMRNEVSKRGLQVNYHSRYVRAKTGRVWLNRPRQSVDYGLYGVTRTLAMAIGFFCKRTGYFPDAPIVIAAIALLAIVAYILIVAEIKRIDASAMLAGITL